MRWLILLAAAALAMDIGVARLGYGLILPAIKADLSGSYGTYGYIAALHLGSYLIGSMIAPSILRLLNWRYAFILAHLLLAAGLLSQSYATTIEVLAVTRALLGIASGLGVLFAIGAALELAAPQERLRVSAMMWTGVAIGIVLSAPAGGWVLVEIQRWRDVSRWTAFPALIIALIAMLTKFPVSIFRETETPISRIRDTFQQLGSSVYLLWSYALYGFAYFIYATFIFISVSQGLQMGNLVTWLWVVFGVTAAIGSISLPAFMRGSRRDSAMATAVGLGVLGALASVVPGVGPSILGALFIGLGLTVTPAVANAYVRERVSASAGPSALAVASIACGAGQMVGPSIAGIAADYFGPSSISILVFTAYCFSVIFAIIDRSRQRMI